MTRAIRAAAIAALLALPWGCATEGAGAAVGVGFYGEWWDDSWYWGGGCCVDYPDSIGPIPHPEHPIVRPDPPRPTQPIASQRPMSMPMPRPAMRGGGGRR